MLSTSISIQLSIKFGVVCTFLGIYQTNRIPSVYHPYTIRIPSVYHPYTTQSTSRIPPYTTVYHRIPPRVLAVYHRIPPYTTTYQPYTTVYHPYTIRIPSVYPTMFYFIMLYINYWKASSCEIILIIVCITKGFHHIQNQIKANYLGMSYVFFLCKFQRFIKSIRYPYVFCKFSKN